MLAKEGYKGAINGTAKIKVDVDVNGNLIMAGSGTTAAGTKTISITRANADNSAADNNQIMTTLLGFIGVTPNDLSNTFDVKWEMV